MILNYYVVVGDIIIIIRCHCWLYSKCIHTNEFRVQADDVKPKKKQTTVIVL